MSRPIGKILILFLTIILVIILGVSVVWLYNAKAGSPGEPKEKVGPIYETEEFTVNMSNTLNHFIKARFALELSNEKALKEIEKELPILQDTIIMVLSGQTLESLSTTQGKENLKNLLINAINSMLDSGQVNKVYFKNIIFQ